MTVKDLIKTLLDFNLNASLDYVNYELTKSGPVFEIRLQQDSKQKPTIKKNSDEAEESFLKD